MADNQRTMKIWYDPEGDYLEVIFEQRPGYFRETENDQVMEKVDEEGNVRLLRTSGQPDAGEAGRGRTVTAAGRFSCAFTL